MLHDLRQMRINGFIDVSLIEYPDKISSVIYTSPCNFRCPFCHNPGLVCINNNIIDENAILDDLKERASFIEGVSITGGEPLLQDNLFCFLREIKNMGLLIKIDTNGYLSKKVELLIKEGLVDYIAMDIKSSLKKYNLASGIIVDITKITDSIKAIIQSNIDYEFRITVVPGIVDENDFNEIGMLIKDAKIFSIQQFDNSLTLDSNLKNTKPYSINSLHKFADLMKKYVKKVKIKNLKILV